MPPNAGQPNRQMAMQAFASRAGSPGPQPSSQPGGMSAGGIKQLQQSQPNEALAIVKALIQRLRDLSRAEFGDKNASPTQQ